MVLYSHSPNVIINKKGRESLPDLTCAPTVATFTSPKMFTQEQGMGLGGG